MNSKSRNDVFYFIVLVLTVVTMLIGITFTYLSLMSAEDDDSTRVKTGTLAINYVDGEDVNSTGLIPRGEPNLNTTFAVYKKNFSVRSSGTLDQNLDIYMFVTSNEFKSGDLMFSIYDSSNNRIGRGSIPASGRVLLTSSSYLKSNTTNNYTVLIWFQDNGTNQNADAEKSFVGGFDIVANQIMLK